MPTYVDISARKSDLYFSVGGIEREDYTTPKNEKKYFTVIFSGKWIHLMKRNISLSDFSLKWTLTNTGRGMPKKSFHEMRVMLISITW